MTKLVTNKKNNYLRPLIGSALVGTSLFQLALPVLAEGTSAGVNISNTATATYEDPTGTPLTSTSNTVTITVAEVAGITNVAQVPVDPNGGSVIPGDTVQFPFLITNTGNNPTGIFVPSPDNVTTQNLVPGSVQVLIDINNDGTADITLNPGDAGVVIPGVAADASITVTVQGTVASVVSGSIITAQLGNTGSNNSSNPDSQNQADLPDTALTNEIRTVDGANGDAGETAGAPINGEREAADTSSALTVGQVAPKPLALAKVLKTAASVDDQATPAFTDDVITYDLSLQVQNDLPLGLTGYDPAGLEGTTVNVDTVDRTVILVSDAIPEKTVLDAAAPLVPPGWRVVYTTDALTTTATEANWVTVRPGAGITRIGFIYDPDSDLTTASPVLPRNTTVSGFTFYVLASGATDDGGTPPVADPIYNLAQVFGETQGDTANNIVFDESGDQNPNNFNDNGTPPAENNPTANDAVYGDYDPTATTGNTGDPEDAAPGGTDTNNNNTGAGTDGEPNILVLSSPPEPPPPGNLLNGPLDQPDATGPVGNNDDFVNKSITEGVTNGATVDPAAVTFGNSVKNVSGVDLQNVVLRPIAPNDANGVCASCDYVEARIPNGTKITIQNTGGGGAVVYTYNQGATIAADTITPDVPGSRFELATLTVGQEFDYEVVVDLPSTNAYEGYSVPVVAYVNNDGNDAFSPATELINNIKIDRLYTGYLRLTKEARILRADGTVTSWFNDTAFTDPAGAFPGSGKPQVAPGDRIQYRITYQNVSTATPPSGQFNVTLNANNTVITENGLGVNGNNWALDNAPANSVIDTSNVPGAAVASQGTIIYYNGNPVAVGADQTGPTAASDVTQYQNNVGVVAPGQTGTFSFQRLVN